MTSRLAAQLGDWHSGGAVAQALADRVRMLILDGRMTVGERLPSERSLAAELARSRATITKAYDLLADAGYLERVHGSGTRVALPHRPTAKPATSDADTIDLTISSTGSTPGFHAATMRGLDRLAPLLATSGYSLAGLPELRDRIAARYRERGLPTDADQIVVTFGAMHALSLVLAAFAERGRTAMVEQPTFPHAMEALRRVGMRLVPTPVTPEGWDLPHLTNRLREVRPRVLYTVADFHNPTGATLTDLERARLAASARSAGALLVVDETCAELDIDRGWAPAPVAKHGPAILIGSLSKIAWGGMRIGWIRATREQVERIIAIRPSFDLGAPMLEQCIAVELLDDIESLLSHTRERLRVGRDAVARGVAALDGAVMPDVRGGLSAWVDLGSPISTSLSLTAREHGLLLPPGPRFSASGVLDRFARIPITWDAPVIDAAMERLAAAWRDVHAGRAATGSYQERAVV